MSHSTFRRSGYPIRSANDLVIVVWEVALALSLAGAIAFTDTMWNPNNRAQASEAIAPTVSEITSQSATLGSTRANQRYPVVLQKPAKATAPVSLSASDLCRTVDLRSADLSGLPPAPPANPAQDTSDLVPLPEGRACIIGVAGSDRGEASRTVPLRFTQIRLIPPQNQSINPSSLGNWLPFIQFEF